MARVQATTSKRIRPEQLAAELGAPVWTSGGAPESTDPKVVEAEATQSALDAAVAAHVADPTFGAPAEQKDLVAIRAKAQAVFDGTDTFTAAQMQKLVAAMVLRATR